MEQRNGKNPYADKNNVVPQMNPYADKNNVVPQIDAS